MSASPRPQQCSQGISPQASSSPLARRTHVGMSYVQAVFGHRSQASPGGCSRVVCSIAQSFPSSRSSIPGTGKLRWNALWANDARSFGATMQPQRVHS